MTVEVRLYARLHGSYYTRWYWDTSPYWRTTKGFGPYQSETYTLTYSGNTITGTFRGHPWDQTLQGAPNIVHIMGETAQQPKPGQTMTGDHVPGDRNNHINSNNNKYKTTGGWTDFNWNPSTEFSVGNSTSQAIDNNNQSGSGFRIWDKRCDY